jgi:hypothetical protein
MEKTYKLNFFYLMNPLLGMANSLKISFKEIWFH